MNITGATAGSAQGPTLEPVSDLALAQIPAASPPLRGQAPDGKAPGAMRTIGEVGLMLGIRPHVLRYWERHFARLRPLKRRGSRRLYRPEDIALVMRIDGLLNREGYTIKGAQQVLAAQAGARPSGRRAALDAPSAATWATMAGGPEAKEALIRGATARSGLAGETMGANKNEHEHEHEHEHIAALPASALAAAYLCGRLAAIHRRLAQALDAGG